MNALSFSIAEAAKVTGLSPSHIDRAIRSGALKAKRTSTNEKGDPVGKRVILAGDLESYLADLPDG